MFVGDVRRATTGLGSSWKLSGGRAWSSGPTNVAKNRHVRRATSRSARASAADRGTARAAGRGRLTQRAMAGEPAQSSRNGSAIGQAWGRAQATTAAAITATASAPVIRR